MAPKKPDDVDGRNRNVPNKLAALDERVSSLEKEVAGVVEELAGDIVPDLVRQEMRDILRRWQDDIGE